MDHKTSQETKKIRTQHFLRPTFFSDQKLAWPKIVWTQKKVGPTISSVSNFSDQTLFGPKKFGTKKNVNQQFRLDQILGTKLFSDPSLLWPLFDLTKQISVPRLRYNDPKFSLENWRKARLWLCSAQLVYYLCLLFNCCYILLSRLLLLPWEMKDKNFFSRYVPKRNH